MCICRRGPVHIYSRGSKCGVPLLLAQHGIFSSLKVAGSIPVEAI
jgi:hypothetical protein